MTFSREKKLMYSIKELSKANENNIAKLKSYSIINYNKIFYCDIDDLEDFRNLLLYEKAGDQVGLGLEMTSDLIDSFQKLISPYNFFIDKINKKVSYLYVELDKKFVLNNFTLLQFIISQSEINDFLFLVIDPISNKQLFDKTSRRLVVDTKLARIIITFDYDGDGLIIFE